MKKENEIIYKLLEDSRNKIKETEKAYNINKNTNSEIDKYR